MPISDKSIKYDARVFIENSRKTTTIPSMLYVYTIMYNVGHQKPSIHRGFQRLTATFLMVTETFLMVFVV